MTPERTRAWAALLLLTTAVSYGLVRYFAPPEDVGEVYAHARQDNEIRQVELRAYDLTGKPNLVLVSPRITSPRRSDEYLIATPVFDVVSAAGARWNGKSRVGRLDVSKNRLWLEDKVQLLGTQIGRDPISVATERLEFRMDERLALSDEAAEIRSPGRQVRGVGLRVDLKNDRFALKSVEGVYVPKNRRS